MNAAQIKCNCVDANIALAPSLLSKCYCGANLVACILHMVAKMFFTTLEALHNA